MTGFAFPEVLKAIVNAHESGDKALRVRAAAGVRVAVRVQVHDVCTRRLAMLRHP